MSVSRSTSPSPPATPSRRRLKTCARRTERGCCLAATYFPLAFVYGLTTWAVSVEGSIGFRKTHTTPEPPLSRRVLSVVGVCAYILLNISYTVAVFTPPGSPATPATKSRHGTSYAILPTSESDPRMFDSITVSSTGAQRYCKKCQHVKPDRTHHCSTCKRCVLKMDHHCPWLSTCLGLHNYKAFILFLIYTSLFCWICFIGSARWVWTEVFEGQQYTTEFAPVGVIILAVLSGIIGLVITGFTSWHIYLCSRGQTTIECLERTRYLTGVRRKVEQNRQEDLHHNRSDSDAGIKGSLQRVGHQVLEFHANAVPGALRYEEGEEHTSPTPNFSIPSRAVGKDNKSAYSDSPSQTRESPAQRALRQNYSHYEADREAQRYNDYLDDEEATSMPNAFDLGWRRNLHHIFGPNRWMWLLPICNTTGDGWNWEVSEKWRNACEQASRRKEARLKAARFRDSRLNASTSTTIANTDHSSSIRHDDSDSAPYLGSYDEDATPMRTFRKHQHARKQRQEFDQAGSDDELGSFEVSDSAGDSDRDSDTGH